METFDDLTTYLVRSTEVGQEIALTVLRDGRERQVKVVLGERPGGEEQTESAKSESAGSVWLGVSGIKSLRK